VFEFRVGALVDMQVTEWLGRLPTESHGDVAFPVLLDSLARR